ncbi:MAG: hypothetical protein RLY78_773 [Pseudomonadota bacterium]|jgi:integrase
MADHLEHRDNTWYAVLKVPAKVQHVLGKRRFFKSTNTGDRLKAKTRAAVLVAGWKDQIEKARATLPDPKASFWENLRRDYVTARAEGEDGEGAMLAIEELAERGARKHPDPQEGGRLYRVAIGIETATDLKPLREDWEKAMRGKLRPKTADQAARDVQAMAEHFKYLEAITPDSVSDWALKQLKEGKTFSTFERIGKGCRSFWKHLVLHKHRKASEANPFAEAFTTVQNEAERTDTGRSGNSYTPEQVLKLYEAAVAKGDQPLADLIALGAYTGARIEELCKLTKTTAAGGLFRYGTKNKASKRETPIHPAIVPLVERLMKEAGPDGFLIPSTAANQYGIRSDTLSKAFGRLKISQGYGAAYVFHTMRGTLITIMDRAGVPERIASDVVGHKLDTMTYGLYSSGSSEEQKLEALKRATYPGALAQPK